MFQVPVNRVTVGICVALLLLFGNDVVAPLIKAVGILTAPYVPAA